jgi:GH25 family lysozyme M1 (1,4-beta-N-acetylmuramidase)
VDVASYQGEPSWTKVHASGIRFAFSKVTEDTDYTNPTWPHNRAGMLALGDGLLPGAYHFLHGGNGAAQARHFLSEAGDVSAFAVALDVEASGANASTARDWVEEFKSETGGHPVVGYFPRWYWDQQGRPSLSFFDTIWQSHYVTGTGSASSLYKKVPASWWEAFGGEAISVLQYSSSATVPGISGNCDVNAFRGTLDELRTLALGGEVPPPSDSLPEG